jgi:hypothetical protein
MNGEHLSPKTRELLDKPIEERIAHIQKDSWIFRPSAPPQEKLVLVLDALSKIEIRILALDEVNFTEVGIRQSRSSSGNASIA